MTEQEIRGRIGKILYCITAFHENKQAGHTINKDALNYLEVENELLSLLTEAETRGRIDQMESIKPFFLRPSMYDLKRVYDEELTKLQEQP